jgi:hypothetical protein
MQHDKRQRIGRGTLLPAAAGGLLTMTAVAGEYRLQNGALEARIAVPTVTKEAGQRFDALGSVTSLTWRGHAILSHDGLLDEFNIQNVPPPGYTNAAVGQVFLKPGIGELVRDGDKPYEFWHSYPVGRLADTRVTRHDAALLRCEQRLDGTNGWGYLYAKEYRLDPDGRSLAIGYRLENTGRKELLVEQYNHNWFACSNVCAVRLETGFDVADAAAPWLAPSGRVWRLTAPLTQAAYFGCPATSAPAASNVFALVRDDGVRIDVSGDFALARFAVFATPAAFCPEAFGLWRVAPGESRAWERRYRLSEAATR